MKELSVEEKAQRYDEALERARYWEKNPTVWSSDDICQKLFPELKESSDERIRKSLLYVIEHHPTLSTEEAEEYIAWIEKQAEHANFRNKIQIGDKVTRNKDGVIVNLSQLNRVAKKQGEQKPADTEKGANGNEREIPIPEPPLTIKHAKEVMGIKQNDAWSEEDEENMMMMNLTIESQCLRERRNGEKYCIRFKY